MRFRTLALALALLLVPQPAGPFLAGQVLDVLYIEYPPYYSTDSRGQPRGFLVDRAERIFRQAGITPRYQSRPSKRVLEALRNGDPACSLGWFKTPERETFARFTLPIHTNHPLEALARASDAPRFQGLSTLAAIVASGRFIPGRIAGHSEGAAVDRILAPLNNRTVFVTGEQARLLPMLLAGRFDFSLAAPEEAGHLMAVHGLSPDSFLVLPLADIPQGNTRHIMCSKSVDPDLIRRLNEAIRATQPGGEDRGGPSQGAGKTSEND